MERKKVWDYKSALKSSVNIKCHRIYRSYATVPMSMFAASSTPSQFLLLLM